MDLIYLDYNCFQRGFDDPQQVRIQMEALACHEIFVRAEGDKVRLVWSFMHEDETIICPGHGPMTSVGEEKRHNPFFAHKFGK